MDYMGLLAFFGVMLALALILISLNALLGPKTPESMEDYPYECGVPLYDQSAQSTFHQGYYLLGLLLLLFDIEAAFLFPWTVVYKYLGVFGFIEMFLFILILTYGLLYAWRKGALDWQFEEEVLER
ncbi:MAG: NADH-quinone oxidoreductase subunit A [Hydrogenobacter thermophilus]|uniref:NADH-quinone oxidoreductase subunit A n=1 Tax=Hydrogenobacter thermophilus (strain DSM 6534 / IAM 12695 / TK-6) TaxID=608538 RepID=D3DGC5_HYDTT|nr:NADH-quinone oxidoreductase subunit A [Hydrogenobacter thermophilus]ADO44813.1 NADH-ubiquinone/plastoquinone oxidoreductase chain 3 [Hydrogenobacter thermophilus TK-6]QWK20149.1 MAG: NADH-quinone oxidoreductase subunit A [Hydrogenobacter thermophilus]BAI68877.1 NADH dehydrogenase chain A [Hydrogenobacter thermophilus TK-6]GBC88287.1 NAD(P)H-quinone oxidoreductase subunit 3 [bacterium HR13]